MTKPERSGQIINILKYIGISVLILIGAYLSFYLVFDKVSPNHTVKTLGYKNYSILTDSMEPTIMVGDLVVIKKHNFDNLEEGDIIAFLVDSNKGPVVVVHRFVRYERALIHNEDGTLSVGENVLITRREGTNQTDNWPNQITEDRFIGKYSYKIPKVGNFIMFLQSWIGIVTIVGSAVIIVVVVWIVNELQKNETEKELDLEENNQIDQKE